MLLKPAVLLNKIKSILHGVVGEILEEFFNLSLCSLRSSVKSFAAKLLPGLTVKIDIFFKVI